MSSSTQQLEKRFDASSLKTEDLEEEEIQVQLNNDGRLDDDDLLQFVSVYLSDEYGNSVRDNELSETDKKGARITWVENSKTGELMAISRRNIKTNELKEGKIEHNRDKEQERTSHEIGDEEAVDSEHFPLLSRPTPLSDNDDIEGTLPQQFSFSTGTTNGGENDFNSLAASITAYYSSIMWQRLFFVFFQGLLSGFVFTIVYSQETFTSDHTLLEAFQSNAQEYRRFLYILSAISCIGCWDQLLTILHSRKKMKVGGGKNQQIDQYRQMMMTMNSGEGQGKGAITVSLALSVLIAFLFSLVYLCTVLMGSQDVLIATKNGSLQASTSSDTTWIDNALADPQFRDDLATWKDLNRARFLAAVIGWIGCCILLCLDFTTVNTRGEELYRVRENLTVWVRRVCQMEGSTDSGLEYMNRTELRRLICIQQTGLDRMREALSYYESEDNVHADDGGEKVAG